MKTKANTSSGFTLIELIVVIAGLGILSSLTIPNVIKYLDYARVDEAKSLLNSSAADCLQQLRRKGTSHLNQTLNENIISDDRLKSTGYRFENTKNANKCSDTMITAISEDSKERLPDLGFTISTDGTLTKQAVDTGTDSSYAAKSWAGKEVLEAAGLNELRDYKQQIQDAKDTCNKNFDKWKATKPTGSKPKWNPSATSGCPTKPPKIVSNTCTTNGCNDEVFYLDGDYCGTEQKHLEVCLEKKLGKLCTEKLNHHKTNETTDLTAKGTQITECNNKVFWFCKGIDKGSKAELENCLREGEEKSCVEKQEIARETGHTGKFGPLPGPGKCADVKWICDKTFVSEKDYFIKCPTQTKSAPAKCSGSLGSRDKECWDYETTKTLVDACGARPLKSNGYSKDCGAVGQGKPNHHKGWGKFSECATWAKCMGF